MKRLLSHRPKSVFCLLLAGLFLFPSRTQAGQPLVPAQSAQSFIETLGVNTHMLNSQWGGSYANVPRTESQLLYLGFRYARDNIYGHVPIETLKRMNHDIGIRFNLWVRGDDYAQEIRDILANPQLVAEVEGSNEVDTFNARYLNLVSYEAAIEMQKQLFTDINYYAPNIPVNNLTVALEGNVPKLGNLSAYADHYAFHIYPQWGGPWGSFPYPSIQYAIGAFAGATPGRTPTITEAGYWTKPAPTGVTEMVQAKSLLNFVFDAYSLGVRRTYIYQLADEYADSSGREFEHHFGLFRNDSSPKVAATAFRNLTTLLNDWVNPAPSSLAYSISGMPATGHQLLLKKSNGNFIIVVWNDVKVWDNLLYREVAAPIQQVRVDLGTQASQVRIFDPLVGTTPTKIYQNIQGLNVTLLDHPVLVFVTPK